MNSKLRILGIHVVDVLNEQLKAHRVWYTIAIYVEDTEEELIIEGVVEDTRSMVYKPFVQYRVHKNVGRSVDVSTYLRSAVNTFLKHFYPQLILSGITKSPDEIIQECNVTFRDIQLFVDRYDRLPFPVTMYDDKHELPKSVKTMSIDLN